MDENRNRSSLILGVILIAAGLLFFAGRLLGFSGWDNLWPFIIILFGAAFFVGMILGGKQASGLAIPGSIISTIGLILLVQNWLDAYETWAYAWALIVAAVGIGLVIAGKRSGDPEMGRSGWGLVRLGLILFIMFGGFFEFIFNLTGVSERGSQLFWPLLALAAGLALFFIRAYRILTNRENLNWDEGDLLTPVLLFGFGLVWLLVTLGLVSLANVRALLGLWPVLLIVGGLGLLFGRRSPWMGAVLGAIVVAGALWVVFNPGRLALSSAVAWPLGEITGGERVTGSGVMVEEQRDLRGYDEISFSAGGVMEIIQGEQEGVRVIVDENLVEHLIIEVRSDELRLGVEPGYSLAPSQPLRYTVYVRELSQVSTSGSGEFRIDSLISERLTLSSSGLAKFSVHALQANELRASISGSGMGQVDGVVDRLELEISGSGNFQAEDLQARQAQVQISGSGNAVVWVSESLEAQVSGSGNISYYGSPQVEQEASGQGEVNRLGDK